MAPSIGRSTAARAPFNMSAYAKLLMSSEVHPKCTHSSCAAAAPRICNSERIQISTDLTSCLVRDSMALIAATSVAAGSAARDSSQLRATGGSAASAAAAGPRASANSHEHSTRTRSRISPASLNR